MGKELLFWILLLFYAFYGWASGRAPSNDPNGRWYTWGGNLLLFLLFLVLGWSVFGAPLK
jgi:hypothetical protein